MRDTLFETEVLDLTVCCRSNDVVWGAYGANAVHFSFLQEYLAGRMGVGVGTMYQLSNNFHGYVSELERLGESRRLFEEGIDPYENMAPCDVGRSWDRWDEDLNLFMGWHDLQWRRPSTFHPTFANDWFTHTAIHVTEANRLWRSGSMSHAMGHARDIGSPDWRAACVAWLERRVK